MDATTWLNALQICDSFFPVGAFAYSDGLETAIAHQWVRDRQTLNQWMESWCGHTFRFCEGPALLGVMTAWHQKNWNTLSGIDHELTALKPSSEARESSHTLGKRLLKTSLPLYPDSDLEQLHEKILQGQLKGNSITVYAVLLSVAGLNGEAALLSYGYIRLTGMISAALRLMSFGQQEGQAVLNARLKDLARITRLIPDSEAPLLLNFSPVVDIAQMNHPFLYSRLFRS
ncbi:MAG: hypothetical protein HQM11_12990 [SAR324 cluster bacterium]|nr:hypothetical protein [SAR324 cluster bacterium]